MRSRRTTLQATTPLLASLLSGCVSSVLSTDHPLLGCIEIVNGDTRPHTVHVRVEYEDEEILSKSYTIDGRGEDGRDQVKWIPRQWPDEPGQFRVHLRMDTHSEWVTIESEEELGEYAMQIAYRIDSDGHGIPVWETIDADEYTRECDESIVANPITVAE
ncbi:hypothetical protein [Halopiger goleimassiliensis]|uniref:hypothetical protein n=1 Tax=Halopiger goleimassiliensis TaxID=1293048 RepID=UPI0006781941|nr:hypothetical protein [Halopiger goleimassiliensis]